jgi:hypothetical protein
MLISFGQISVSLKNLWCSECMLLVCLDRIMFGQNWTELCLDRIGKCMVLVCLDRFC